MADQGIYTILTKAAILTRFDPTYGPRLMNCWLPAETWVEVIKRTGHIDASLTIDARKFNAAFTKSSSFGAGVMSRFDGSNNTGVFHVRFQHRQYYYFTQEKRQVPYPNPLNQAWKVRVLEAAAANVLVIPSTRARPGPLADKSTTADDEIPSPNKRPSYLTEFEPYCKRWVQLSVNEAKTIKCINIDFGYSYHDIVSNEERIELHVNYWNQITRDQQQEHQLYQDKKPATSIRVSSQTRPLMMIVGQDESVFAQYLLGSKTWVGPKGQRPLLPKSEGDGYMLSAFVSREFGFGREMTTAELEKGNKERRGIHKTYLDTHAAMEILKSVHKPLLTESPFVKYLYIGANNEGYWNSFLMSLQFEDVVDCLQVLYSEYDFIFLFDHSQGHRRKRHGALSAVHMSRSFGGRST
ncbi:hypothetical protein MHU86_11822 [Fragilaria crotonensis]|nr:hypothetical protein MHU86_11822 [Fragilaria crotonensis]